MPGKPNNWSSTIASSCSRALVFCIVLALHIPPLLAFLGPKTQTYRTGTGESQQIELQRGSQIKLDAMSILTIVRGRFVTTIHLQGRADFNLTHDDSHETVVYVGTLRMTDVGTAFIANSVADSDAPASVVVAEGVVGVDVMQSNGGHADAASPGGRTSSSAVAAANTAVRDHEIAWIETSGSHVLLHQDRLSDEQLRRRTAWLHGELEFENEPLAQVVRELERYYRLRIQLDDSIRDLRISGSFSTTKDLERFLQTMSTLYNLESRPIGTDEVKLERQHSARPGGTAWPAR